MFSVRSGSAIASAPAALQLPERWPVYALEVVVGAALLLSALLATERTTLGQEVYIEAGAAWLAGSLLSALWDRLRGKTDASTMPFSPTTLFLAVVAATFTVHALDTNPGPPPNFSPNNPEELPGLSTHFTPYYLVLLATIVLFVTWYGRKRERETEAGTATLIVCTSLTFELMLRTAGSDAAPSSSTLGIPLLWGPTLVLLVLWLTNERRRGVAWRWTPFAGPVLAFLLAATLSTIMSVYVHASSIMLLRIGAFAALFWLVANLTTGTRQLRLFWLALVGPLAGAGLVIVLKLFELYREVGWDFVLTHRYQISGIAGTNPLGLSLGVAALLVVGALLVLPGGRARLAVGWLLVILLPAFLATHSPAALVALAGGLVGLVIIRFGYGLVRQGPRALGWRLAAAGVIVAVVAVVVLTVPNPYTGKVIGDVTDPTTGRGARPLAWQLAFENFQHNPVLGVGLHNYYARTRYVGDFPAEAMTSVRERRTLLGANIDPWKNFVSFHPHNAYLAILEGMGIFGLAAVAWLGQALAAQAWRLFRRGDGSFAWWATAVPLAGVGMAVAWSFVAQGDDITVIALPFWPLLGLTAAGNRLLEEPPPVDERPSVWQRLGAPLARRWHTPGVQRALRPAAVAVVAAAFLALVARPVAAEALVRGSERATVAQNNPRALELMQWAHRLDPWNAPYLERLSDAYLRAGPFDEAIRTQEQLVNARRYFSPDHVRLGWLYWLSNKPNQALQQFQQAARLDRWDTTQGNVYIPLGLGYANAGRYEEALDAFSYGFQVSPNTIDDGVWLVDESITPPLTYLDPLYLIREEELPLDLQRNIVRRLGHPAVKPAQRPPGTDPDYGLPAVFDAMYREYQATLPTDRDRAEVMLATLGRLASMAELPGQAIAYLEELRGLTPGDDAVHYSLGLAYMTSGNNAQAKAEFQTVIELSEESPEYVLREPFSHFQLGVLALQQEPPDAAAAREEFRDALDTYRWEYFPNLYRYLAITRGLLGDRGGAERDMEKELFLLGLDLDEAAAQDATTETEDLTSR